MPAYISYSSLSPMELPFSSFTDKTVESGEDLAGNEAIVLCEMYASMVSCDLLTVVPQCIHVVMLLC